MCFLLLTTHTHTHTHTHTFVTVFVCACTWIIIICIYIYVGLAVNLQQKNTDHFTKAIYNRPKGTPLITVSNHLSCIDDPLIWGEPYVTCGDNIIWCNCYRCGTNSPQFYKSHEMVSSIAVTALVLIMLAMRY